MEETQKKTGQRNWNDKEMILQEGIRFRPLLRQIAGKFLGCQGDVETVVNRTIVAATKTQTVFASQGELRGWILRVVIDESLRGVREQEDVQRETCRPEEASRTALFFATWLVGVAD